MMFMFWYFNSFSVTILWKALKMRSQFYTSMLQFSFFFWPIYWSLQSLLCVFAFDIIGCLKSFKFGLEFEKILQTCVSKNASKDSQTLPLHRNRWVLMMFIISFLHYSSSAQIFIFLAPCFLKNGCNFFQNFTVDSPMCCNSLYTFLFCSNIDFLNFLIFTYVIYLL